MLLRAEGDRWKRLPWSGAVPECTQVVRYNRYMETIHPQNEPLAQALSAIKGVQIGAALFAFHCESDKRWHTGNAEIMIEVAELRAHGLYAYGQTATMPSWWAPTRRFIFRCTKCGGIGGGPKGNVMLHPCHPGERVERITADLVTGEERVA